MTTGRINQVTTMTLWRCKREREREMPPSLSLTNCPVSHPLPGREGRRQVFFHHWRSSFCLFVLEVDRGGRKPPLPCAQPAKQKGHLCALNLTSFKLGLPVFQNGDRRLRWGLPSNRRPAKSNGHQGLRWIPEWLKATARLGHRQVIHIPLLHCRRGPTQTGLATPTVQRLGNTNIFIFLIL